MIKNQPFMEPFLSRFKNPLVLIAILLIQAIALATQVRRPEDPAHPDGEQVRVLRLWSEGMIAPFERLATSTGHEIGSAWDDYVDLRHVRQHDQDLQKENDQLRLKLAAVAEDAVEAQRLRKLLDFRQHYISQTVAAQVIGTSGSDQSRLLILDKGWRAGLKPGMAVITPDGVVGKLRDVFADTSQLLLLSDPTSGAGVLLQSTRIRAIVKGSSTGDIEITNLTPDDRIKPGEKVLTSGGDQVYPRGLPVGTIDAVKLDPDHPPYTLIKLTPAANLNQLEDVLVVTATSGTLDAETQAELAKDADLHAAAVNAERLPSLHQDKPDEGDAAGNPDAAASAMPPPDDSRDLVPKPKPVQHPDRYSPNSAPPATELKPGGGQSVEPNEAPKAPQT
jgi:rod shape-determining protein MreC